MVYRYNDSFRIVNFKEMTNLFIFSIRIRIYNKNVYEVIPDALKIIRV